MRSYLLAAAAALLSTALSAHAAPLTVDFSGLNGSLGGSIIGSFRYDPSIPLANGDVAISFISVTSLNGINFGGPYTVPEANAGVTTPGTVTSVPVVRNGDLLGNLDFTYTTGAGPSIFEFTFNPNGSATGELSAPSFDLSETFSASAISYQTVSTVTPEPSTIALLSTGLLGLGGIIRRRLA